MLEEVKGLVRRSIERGYATMSGSLLCAREAMSIKHLIDLKILAKTFPKT